MKERIVADYTKKKKDKKDFQINWPLERGRK